MNSQKSNIQKKYLTESIPDSLPLPFKSELTPAGMLIHRGIFSPDMQRYYFTISDQNFTKFDIRYIERSNSSWTQPKEAFFNSEYSDHGMSFSPDGHTIYFSSTRPIEGFADTWHIWQTHLEKGQWTSPELVDIPNLRDQLTSHPSMTKDGLLFFHASNTDYSEMQIYSSQKMGHSYEPAKLVNLNLQEKTFTCTPYIHPEQAYIIFATIETHLKLHIAYKETNGSWSLPQALSENINQQGQGNPYISPDGKFLFYAKEGASDSKNWSINWVSTKSFLKDSR